MTAPGMGSLSVTGPIGGRIGATDKSGVEAMENLIDFGGSARSFPDVEIGGMAEVAPEGSSDIERRRSVITGAQRGARVLPERTLGSGEAVRSVVVRLR